MATPEQTQNPTTTPPAPVIQGGPGDPPLAPTATTQTPDTAPVQAAPIQTVIGNRIFNSKEEADSYLTDLEARSRNPIPTQQPIVTQVEPDPADILFEDPKKAISILENRIEKRIKNEGTLEKTRQAVWDEFYRTNPDLREFTDIVQMQWNQNVSKVPANTSVMQVLPNVAADARKYLARIRGVPNGGQLLSDKPAIVAAPSGATPPTVPQQKAGPTNFVEELKSAYRRSK